MSDNTQLFPAFDTPLADICYNLAQECCSNGGVDLSHDFHTRLLDLRRPLWKKWYLTSEEALWNEYVLDNEALLPGEEGYMHNGEGCVAKADALPYCIVELPLSHHPIATPSPAKPPLMPTPAAVAIAKPLKELTFSAPGKMLAGGLIPSPEPSSISSFFLGGPTTCKRCWDQQAISNLPIPTSNVCADPLVHQSRATSHTVPSKSKLHKAICKSPAPQAAKVVWTAKMPVFNSSSDSDVPKSLTYPSSPMLPKEPLFFPSDNDAASDGVASHVSKCACAKPLVSEAPTLFLMHAYHLLTGEPLPGLIALPSPASVTPVQMKGKGREVIPLSLIPTLPVLSPPSCIQKGPVSAFKAIASGSKDARVTIPSATVDRTVYVHTFDPQVSLQYHEQISHYTLEHMQLSALPAAPASLLKPTTQGHCTAVYGVHSDVGTHILCIPHQYWPCFNCTISGHAHLCKFLENMTPGKEASILEGLQHANHLKNDIGMLYTILLNHIEERDSVIKGLADALDAIAVHEGGTAIIDQYAEAHELIQSLIINVGKYGDASRV
ncbi:hypothetical protein IW261DRAFT_1421988 [Armillaria novae-zelandiae]|uniref:Uncharacterized protein n=1 Tax=Armillaria novae-zelandiae TaxID=153914 RepID=A0AA39P2B4_9AGAR|nr:hypothetical protein IW261DRAFT_1421988 [Armillaria novae-zelandiae]